MSFLKLRSIIFASCARESVSRLLARVNSSPRQRKVEPKPGQELGEYLFMLRTRRKRSVQEVAETLGNAFPQLGISAARIARLESGDQNALSDDAIRVLAGHNGGLPDKAVELARIPSASRSWVAMSARARDDLQILVSEERDFLEHLLDNILDELRKEDSTP